MTTDATTFLKETFPKLFTKGVGLLRAKADAGDESAKRKLNDIVSVTGATKLQIDDNPPIYLSAKAGELVVSDSPQADVPVKVAAALPSNGLDLLLGEATKAGALEDDRAAIGAAQTTSQRFEDALAGAEMTCHLTVKDVPDLGDVLVRVGFNVEEPPSEPGFTTEIGYADLKAAQDGATTVQELFMAGKLRMGGDYSNALQIAMQLMTNPL